MGEFFFSIPLHPCWGCLEPAAGLILKHLHCTCTIRFMTKKKALCTYNEERLCKGTDTLYSELCQALVLLCRLRKFYETLMDYDGGLFEYTCVSGCCPCVRKLWKLMSRTAADKMWIKYQWDSYHWLCREATSNRLLPEVCCILFWTEKNEYCMKNMPFQTCVCELRCAQLQLCVRV